MILKKAVLLGAIMALGSTPAWALPGGQHGNKGGPASTPGAKGKQSPEPGQPRSKGPERHHEDNADKGNGKGKGRGNGPGAAKSRRCVAHAVAYVASGVLVSDTLVEGADRTYSGELTVEVEHGNRHSRGDQGTKKTYDLQDARLTFSAPGFRKGHIVGTSVLVPGDHVQLIGQITALPKGCAVSEFTPQLTIGKVVIHGPRHTTTTTATATTTTTTTSTSTAAAS